MKSYVRMRSVGWDRAGLAAMQPINAFSQAILEV